MDEDRILEICRKYKGCSPVYYVDSIPDRKIINSRRTLEIPETETIYALVDFTVFGSAEDAMVITGQGIAWKNIADKSPARVTWRQLQSCEVTEHKGFLDKIIHIGSDYKISLSGASKLIEKENHSVVDLLNDLKQLGDPNAQSVPQGGSGQESEIATVVCEFCGKSIKPEVTYCKHCGIKLRG